MAETKTGRRGYLGKLARQLEEGADRLMRGWSGS